MVRLIPIVFLLFSGSLGCSNVNPSDLAGTWTIDDESRRYLPPEVQKASSKVVLDANGTFVASDMPGMFLVHPGLVRVESGRGVWKLVSTNGAQQIQLNFHEISDQKETKVPYGTQINVSSGILATTLFYFLGGPDEGRRVDLAKEK